ncbi:unnamed protein product [Rotaria sordida]|uniref:Uncharacterized protein n=1 Tax=Rotaria sordida TaxID=392033 RepID=A0A815F3N7_9BILA|nr:unnamed protein product [Rotaria sordida]CAF1109492.1 unnamed protein product [Rotaria sordida]CAF1320847.1 unnamed protein product [Rotaria sordida]CAF3739620.1 unnamed protein product [Rotaria sordida]
MTQFGITNSNNNELDRILPLPYLPTYIARRPVSSKSNSEDTIPIYNSIFATNWLKASDNHAAKHRNVYGSPYINIDLESIQTLPKQYDTYKQYLYQQDNPNSTDSLNRIHPLIVPNHLTRTSMKWSQFLDEHPDRFKINYPLPDEENDLYVPPRPGRYPYQTNKELPNFYAGLTSRIHPVTNPFRQMESRQKCTVAHPIWIPYGTASHR